MTDYDDYLEAKLQHQKAIEEREYFKKLWEQEGSINNSLRIKSGKIFVHGMLLGVFCVVIGNLIVRVCNG